MNSQRYFDILNGRFENLPKQKSKVVRIFLSSTFSDFHTERDYLIEKIFPRLKLYCKTKYGLEFQVLDMRWGISHEITNSHTTTSICLNEIGNCQKNSVGPNFVTFLSHRYGSRSLPERILSTEFEMLRKQVTAEAAKMDLTFEYEGEEDAIIKIDNLLEFCYELDENEQPARWRLIRLEKAFKKYDPKKETFEKVWSKIELKLGSILRSVAQICFGKGLFNKTQYERFFVSVTEKEIFKGVLSANNVTNNVLFFSRNIVDIEKYVGTNKKLMSKFIDLNKKGHVDEEVKVLLNTLKDTKISKALPSSNIFKFDVNWSPEFGISLQSHRGYIEKFAEAFYEQVKLLIDRNQKEKVDNFNANEKDLELIKEVLDHAYFCNETAEKFRGRVDILNKVNDYLLGDSPRPFVIHGESGCGKTAICAKVFSQILTSVPDPFNYTTILRFLGTTPTSSNIYRTINSIIHQLSKLFMLPMPKNLLTKSAECRDFLQQQFFMLESAFPNRKVVILLDSLDQITNMKDLNWVPTLLPPNVKIILSTLPSHGQILDKLKKILDEKADDSFIEITSLDQTLAKLILNDFLTSTNRTISEHQWKVVDKMLANAKLFPLYVTLVFDVCSKWPSFYEPDVEFTRCVNIDKCIMYLFKLLEVVHGKLLFSRAITYMSLFSNGISETEIEDILSLDDDVLYDVFEFHAPPIRKLPIALWSRIKYDLKGYMVEKEVHNTKVIYWYHRRFIEVANSYYISKLSSTERDFIFINVVDFFNETWKHKPKPYKYNDFIAKKKQLNTTDQSEIRDTSIQPTYIVDDQGCIQYNQRKINELPDFISNLTHNIASSLACDYIYFNYHFLMGMFLLRDFSEIMDSLRKLTESSSYSVSNEAKEADTELKLLNLIFLQCGVSMNDRPSSTILQILSRSMHFYGQKKYFTKLIDEYDQESSKANILALPYQQMDAPGKDLIFQLDRHNYAISHAVIGGENDCIVFTLSNKIHGLNMESVKDMGEIRVCKEIKRFSHFIAFLEDDCPDKNLPIKAIKGFFVVGSENEVQVISNESNVIFKKDFADKVILEIVLVSCNHLAIVFLNEKNVTFFNVNTGELTKTHRTEKRIFGAYSNTHKMYIHFKKTFQNDAVFLALVFETHEVEFIEVNQTQLDLGLELDTRVRIPPSDRGHQVCSISFAKDDVYSFDFSDLRVFYSNGAILSKKWRFDGDSLFQLWKSNSAQLKGVHFKFLSSFRDINLFLGSNKNLYMSPKEVSASDWDKKLLEIEGNFDNGYMLKLNTVVGFSKGLLSFFLIGPDADETKITKKKKKKANEDGKIANIRYVKVAEVNAHFDDITFFFLKGPMFMTTSKDSTLKVFAATKLEAIENDKFTFDKSERDIQSLHLINESHVIAQLTDSNSIDIWNLAQGRISSTYKIEGAEGGEIALDLFYANSKVLLISKTNKTSRNLFLRGLHLNQNVLSYKKFYNLEFEMQIDQGDCESYKIVQTSNDSEFGFMLFTETLSKPRINLQNLSFEGMRKKQTLPGKVTIVFGDILAKRNQLLLENVYCTYRNKLIVIFYECNFYMINNETGQILAQENIAAHRMTTDYFLSPTNLTSKQLHNMKTIQNSDSVIALDNKNNLILFHFKAELNKLYKAYICDSVKNEPIVIESFQISLNLIILFYKNENKLQVLSLESLFKKFKIEEKSVVFEIMLEDSILGLYGLSSNNHYVYFIENKKVLRFFNVSKRRELISTQLYSEPKNALCNSDYICLSMQDNRVISFIINDPVRSDSYERLRKLPSRSSDKDPEIIKKIKQIFEASLEMLDNSSSDEDQFAEDLFLKEKSRSEKEADVLNYTKFKNRLKRAPKFDLACFDIDVDIDKNNNEKENVKLPVNWMSKHVKDDERNQTENDASLIDRLGQELNELDESAGKREANDPQSDLSEEFRRDLIQIFSNSSHENRNALKTLNSGKSVKIAGYGQISSQACNVQ